MKPWTVLPVACLLAFALPPASADPDPAALSARCDFTTAGVPNTNEVVVALTGAATAPGAAGTRISCELLDPLGGTVASLDWFLVGSAAAGATTAQMGLQVLTVCTSASAVYVDGSTAELERSCVPA
jgi:hypothetical protein